MRQKLIVLAAAFLLGSGAANAEEKLVGGVFCDTPEQVLSVVRSASEGGVPLEEAVTETNRVAKKNTACGLLVGFIVANERVVREVIIKGKQCVIERLDVIGFQTITPFGSQRVYFGTPLTQYMISEEARDR